MTSYGPHNPHPLSLMRTELVWEGKYDEFGNRREVDVAGLAMPLQKIETIDEPRSRAEAQGSLFDEQKAHRDDFRNRLIWGDNKLVMASLLEEFKGAIDLIYIDPPFDVGADFTVDVPLSDSDSIAKDQSIIEMVVYRDTWGRGTDSYLHMMFERLSIMRDLLSETGAIFVHCDQRVNYLLRSLMDHVLGSDHFRNEIIRIKCNPKNYTSRSFGYIHDTILFYTKSERTVHRKLSELRTETELQSDYPQIEEETERRYTTVALHAKGIRHGATGKSWRDVPPPQGRHWAYVPETLDEFDAQGRIEWSKTGNPRLKRYADEDAGKAVQTIWEFKDPGSRTASYATEKPESLLERILRAGSDDNSLVADFFCGSGTTLAVAEKLGRRWLGADLGRFAVHTTRKRLIGLQRDLHQDKRPYRSFDVYNLGRYERQWWQKEALQGADDEHRVVVLKFFRAEILNHAPSPLIHGRKGAAFVHVDGIDSIFMRGEASEVAKAVKAAGGHEVHCLAWDFEMDLRQAVAAIEVELDIRLRLHRIPREIMEKNRKEVPPFFEVALLEAEPVLKNAKDATFVDIKLNNFLPSLTEVPAKELEALQERAVESGFDFIDFWAVDFDWSPNRPFNHHWQDYRSRKDRSLKTVSDAGFVYDTHGKHTVCVKVVDVFGCDTSITVEIEL